MRRSTKATGGALSSNWGRWQLPWNEPQRPWSPITKQLQDFDGTSQGLLTYFNPARLVPVRCRMSRLPLSRSVTMQRVFLVGFALALFSAPTLCRANDWRYEETHREARDFVAGGSVHLHLSVGDVHIRRGTSSQLRLEYTVKSKRESNLKKAAVDFEVHGNEANISFHAPTGANTEFDVDLEVPASTNLDVHEKVGDLTVEN